MRSSDTMMKAKNNGVYESLKERNDAMKTTSVACLIKRLLINGE